MNSFTALAEKCPLNLREASPAEQAWLLSGPGANAFPPDSGSPMGMNDSYRVAAYFRSGCIVYIPW